MKISPQLVMLAVAGVTGSVLFAAEANRQAQQRAVAMAPAAEVDKDKKLPNATDPVTGKPAEAGAPSVEADEAAANSSDSKADPAADAKQAGAAADKAADKGAATTAKSSKSDADRVATPQRFVPSEEVRADFDVSFPVDI